MNAIFRPWPRLLNEQDAARYLSIGASTLRERGPQPKHVGRRSLWDIRDLDRWADALAGEPLDDSDRDAEGDDIHRRAMERLERLADGSN